MPSSPIDPNYFTSFDGTRLAWYEMGEGAPVVLLHGLFSDAWTNWIRYGHAAAIAASGRRVIMPDLRAHGRSASPHDADAYPPDVLASDARALIAHLGLGPFDLGGYSLGGRTAARMVVGGTRPGRLVIAGMGLGGLLDTGRRAAYFRHVLGNLGSFARGTPEWFAEAFLKTTGGDPVALTALLGSFVDTTAADLSSIIMPTLIVAGVDDHDNGSATDLADTLPDARFVATPGNHMSAVVKAELGEAFATFLSSDT